MKAAVDVALLDARVSAACVLFLAAFGKLLRKEEAIVAVRALGGIFGRLRSFGASVVIALLALAELAVGGLSVLPPWNVETLVASALLGFVLTVSGVAAARRTGGCSCFGTHTKSSVRRVVIRNTTLFGALTAGIAVGPDAHELLSVHPELAAAIAFLPMSAIFVSLAHRFTSVPLGELRNWNVISAREVGRPPATAAPP